MDDSKPLIPEVVESDPFRDFALLARQYWMAEYERLRADQSAMSLEEFLDLHWQKKPKE